jgi:hypothetical protein
MKETKQQFIERNKALFWSVSPAKRSEISDILLVETILNYGTWEDFLILLELLTLPKAASIFFNATDNRQRHNYLPPVENYFRLYFSRRLTNTSAHV